MNIKQKNNLIKNKKLYIKLINKFILILFLIIIPTFSYAKTKKESGVNLDIARHFYPVSTIKKFIDNIKSSGGTFLHLHISDDDNYAIESEILGQREKDAQRKNGVYINPKTQKPFLSYNEIKEISNYAKSKNIELIPEIDTPSHMQAIFTLLELKHGKEYVNKMLETKDRNRREIIMKNPKNLGFVKGLIGEVIDLFGNSSKHFHIGGDEFVGSEYEFMIYANSLNSYITKKGKKTRMWNDGILKKYITKFNKNIEITYWSHDGDTQNSNESINRKNTRAGMNDLINNGFKVLNYNSYYLYITPSQTSNLTADIRYAANDLEKNWDLGIWDGQNTQNRIKNTTNIIGAAVSIWGEDAKTLSASLIQNYSTPLLTAFFKKVNSLK